MIIIAPIAPLMKEANPTGELADEALYGMTATLIGEEKGMLKINMSYRYEGFIAADGLLRNADVKNWSARAAHQVIAPFADIKTEPTYQSQATITLPRGALLEVGAPFCDEKGETDWLSATLADGQSGFVRRHNVRLSRRWGDVDEATTRSGIVADAKLYLGAQYRWGGKSCCGIDCSGLAAMAYMLSGLFIYRDARIVEGYPVKEIAAQSAKPADLLYWPGHVALYLGDGRYIHSTGKASGVVINSLNPEHAEYREDLATVEKWGSVF